MKNCGNCKWLDVPDWELTKKGRPHKRLDHYMYFCRVPFVIPELPASVTMEVKNLQLMCPTYGDKCTFHEPRMPALGKATATTVPNE